MITSDFIKVVAKSLEHLKKDVVFTGGAVVNLYSTDTAATDIRPTDDIDCVVKAVRRSDYNNFEEQLRKLGFVNDLSGKAPICRYICKGIKVDFIPTEEKILGFKNKWYAEGFDHAVDFEFEDGFIIKIFSPEYFLASKIDAFWDRGRKDMRLSTDFEDVVFMFNSRKELLSEIKNSSTNVLKYIIEKMNYFISHQDIEEGIIAVLPYGSGDERMRYIKNLMQEAAGF